MMLQAQAKAKAEKMRQEWRDMYGDLVFDLPVSPPPSRATLDHWLRPLHKKLSEHQVLRPIFIGLRSHQLRDAQAYANTIPAVKRMRKGRKVHVLLTDLPKIIQACEERFERETVEQVSRALKL